MPVTNGYIGTTYTAKVTGPQTVTSPVITPTGGYTFTGLGAGTYALTIATSTINGISATYTHSPTMTGEPESRLLVLCLWRRACC